MSTEVVVKPTSPTAEGELVHDSEEYESAEEIEEEYEEEEEVEEIEVEVEEDDEEDEEPKDDEGKEKALDDDEDRKNPQFIPKKGYFYEHDDRMMAEDMPGEEEPPAKEERPRKESVTKVKEKVISDRWAHDLFDESEQAPKSSGELEERYGYDIRSDDMAPRARRKRVYGRGPTKYTRNWEEEEAYHRPRGGFRGRRAGTRGRDVRQPARRGSKGYDEDFPQLPDDVGSKENEEKTGDGKSADIFDSKAKNEGRDRRGRGGAVPRPRREEDEVNDQDDKDRNYGRGQPRTGRGRGRRNEFANRNRYPDRRGSGSTEANSTSTNRVKSREEQREWEQKVDRMREQDKAQKQANGTRRNLSPSEREFSASKSPGSGKAQQQKKATLPFTNTEYTGSASLTANRNQESKGSTYKGEESQGGNGRDNISVKVINAGPEQGNREVRISDKDRPGAQQSGMDRRNQAPATRPQAQQQPPETAKPKRFSTQRQKQDVALGTSQVSASPPPVQRGGGANNSPQPIGVQMASNVPASVMSGYNPAPHSQTYYDQVPVQMPTNYDAQRYESSGSPITVPISAHGHGPSASPSLWTSQHSAYSTSPYPSPPTGPAPSVQPPYDPSGYIGGPQPQIFAPPPHPHPQFISDPTIINYVPPVPPQTYPPPFHPQGFQGYQPVNPVGGPELYHGGVTYYSPQTQMQRPHMMVPSKRPKSVLQLVEPSKQNLRQGPRPHLPSQEEALLISDMYLHQYREESLPHVVDYMNTSTSSSEFTATKTTTEQLAQKFDESVRLQPKPERVKKSPSPAPIDLTESPSWADQMADLTPLSSPSEQSSRKNSDFQGVNLDKVGGEGKAE